MIRTLDQYSESLKSALLRKEFIEYPSTAEEWCVYYRIMDDHFSTLNDSPLHHDNSCKICK